MSEDDDQANAVDDYHRYLEKLAERRATEVPETGLGFTAEEVAKVFDVPIWLIDETKPRTRWRALRWHLSHPGDWWRYNAAPWIEKNL